jgi:hypothetical protein
MRCFRASIPRSHPALIQQVADYVRSPEAEAVEANTSITAKAQELGELRHEQRASLHQVLGEYRLLGSDLATFVQEEVERLHLSPATGEALDVLRRINDAIWILMQTTVNTFVTAYTKRSEPIPRASRASTGWSVTSCVSRWRH